ncbi:MAG: response regulator receiver domain [Pseudomonadota bacterium]
MAAAVIEQGSPADIANQEWTEHCLSAVRRFLKNVVVIDNEPFVEIKGMRGDTNFSLQPPDNGLDAPDDLVITPIQSAHQEHEDINAHRLDVRKISDAFAEEGLACAFVLPDDDSADEDGLVRRALNSALISDIVVIDWFLFDNSPNLTKRILKEIAQRDASENGRVRFICVYTGQPLLDTVGLDVTEALGRGGIHLNPVNENLFFSKSQSCFVAVLNKQTTLPIDLPKTLINLFIHFADGILPTFALAAIGAIRKNTHHMVTRFGRELDSAYIANRLITNPPEDVAELMRDLLVAECDNALGLESVADHYLDKKAIDRWLNKHEASIAPQAYGDKQVDMSLLKLLLNHGIDQKRVGEPAISLPVEKRNKVSIALAGNADCSKDAEAAFSRLVVFKREAFGDTKLLGDNGWLPSLTTGTLLRLQEGEAKRYFICLTPACDTLRLSAETPFVFIEATIDDNRYSIILKEEDGNRGIYFRGKHPTLKTYSFLPDTETQRVRGETHQLETNRPTFNFSTINGRHRFTWLGEIRYARAASEMAKLAGNWMRIGINDSEHLRLIEAGKFK